MNVVTYIRVFVNFDAVFFGRSLNVSIHFAIVLGSLRMPFLDLNTTWIGSFESSGRFVFGLLFKRLPPKSNLCFLMNSNCVCAFAIAVLYLSLLLNALIVFFFVRSVLRVVCPSDYEKSWSRENSTPFSSLLLDQCLRFISQLLLSYSSVNLALSINF